MGARPVHLGEEALPELVGDHEGDVLGLQPLVDLLQHDGGHLPDLLPRQLPEHHDLVNAGGGGPGGGIAGPQENEMQIECNSTEPQKEIQMTGCSSCAARNDSIKNHLERE